MLSTLTLKDLKYFLRFFLSVKYTQYISQACICTSSSIPDRGCYIIPAATNTPHPQKWVLDRSPVHFLSFVLELCAWIKNIAVKTRSSVLACTHSKTILHLKILSTLCPWIEENVLHPRTHFSGCSWSLDARHTQWAARGTSLPRVAKPTGGPEPAPVKERCVNSLHCKGKVNLIDPPHPDILTRGLLNTCVRTWTARGDVWKGMETAAPIKLETRPLKPCLHAATLYGEALTAVPR